MTTSQRPLIGLTTHPRTAPDVAELDLLLDQIAEGVDRAGGLPVIIPLEVENPTLRALYERLDGILFSGGGDIDPALYGAETNDKVGGVDAGRDRIELSLAQWAVEEEKPLFGICRGAQLLNVALGGTLYRDVLEEHPGAERHAYYPGFPYDLRPHLVAVEEDTRLARTLGVSQGDRKGRSYLAVNSLHHQACKVVAPRLVASARAPDGVVEAVELPHHPFALAVQWHPECLPDAPEMRQLFEAFVEAANDR